MQVNATQVFTWWVVIVSVIMAIVASIIFMWTIFRFLQ
jgi:NO-binding membrane sensor protein with MHYT domain